MPANYVLLEKITVGAGGATSVTFSGIPQTGYTDLVVKISGRTNRNYGEDQFIVRFNSDTGNNYASRFLQAYDGAVATNSESGTNTARFGMISAAGSVANGFGNAELYIANYTSSTYKPISTDAVSGGSASPVGMWLTASLWSNTAAINSIFLDAANGTEWLQHSTFYLYGVAKLNTTPAIQAKATGGNIIMTDGTYWYHAFLSSGTFTPTIGVSCDVLVVAGGGSGGWPYSGAGGAGGVIAFAAQSLSTAQTVTVGAGAAGAYNTGNGSQGSNSVFGSLTAAVGGGGGIGANSNDTRAGGSGGGGSAISRQATFTGGGSATSGQGNAGGAGSPTPYTNEGGGGGGGAGGAGGNATGVNSGAGGAGTNSVTNWGALSAVLTATGLGVSGYIAGGGGGGTNGAAANAGAGGSGGGGRGASNDGTQESQAGTANTGGGSGGGAAGGAPASPKSGGSGLVIVRYTV